MPLFKPNKHAETEAIHHGVKPTNLDNGFDYDSSRSAGAGMNNLGTAHPHQGFTGGGVPSQDLYSHAPSDNRRNPYDTSGVGYGSRANDPYSSTGVGHDNYGGDPVNIPPSHALHAGQATAGEHHGGSLTGKVEKTVGSLVGSKSLKAKGMQKEQEAQSLKVQSGELAEAERLEHEALMRRERAVAHGAHPDNGYLGGGGTGRNL